MNWVKVTKLLKNPQKLSKIPEIKYWLFIILILNLFYFALSSGDFSFCLTLSSLLESLSFIGIILQVKTSTDGLSCNTFITYSTIYFSRLCSILFYESYLPYDSTGDWIFQVIEIFCFGQSVFITYRLWNIKEKAEFLFTLPVFAVLAFVVHPSLNKNFFTDSLWMYSMLLQGIVVLPLLWKVKEHGDLESFSSHFIAAHSVSAILSFFFWAKTYSELNRANFKSGYFAFISGYFVIAGQLGSLATTGHFLFHYIKSAVLGTPLILPH